MGLRARLALFFVVITVVPLAVTVVALRLQIDAQVRQRAVAELDSVRDATVSLAAAQRARAGDLATDLVVRGAAAVLDAGDPAAAQQWLSGALDGGTGDRADAAVLVGADGRPLAGLADQGSADDALLESLAAAAAAGEPDRGFLLEVREVRGPEPGEEDRLVGWVATGVRLDGRLLARLVEGEGAAVVAEGEVVAGLGPLPVAPERVPEPGPAAVVDDDGRAVLAVADLGDGHRLVLWSPLALDVPATALALLVVVAAVLLAGGLGWALAGGIVAPVRRAADVARAIAGGDLNQSLEPRGGRELADLAIALNVMSSELASHITEVERSRDLLRRSLTRLGQTLSSSLDINPTLAVVVETAMETLEADRGVLRLFTPERDALYVKVARGAGDGLRRLSVDEGVAGWAARTGNAARLPAEAHQTPAVAEGELPGAQRLVVPLRGRGGVLGVLSLARDEHSWAFGADDLDALKTFANQASGAIENVMLHHETRRLSVTDPLTGLWNLRYLQLQLERELESAARFDRPLSVLIVDLDRFKQVNDEHGHQVGDEVLIEVASRLRDATRVPDVVARYGGEEFVVLLPDTDQAGVVTTAERIRSAVAGVPVAVSDPQGGVRQMRVTCSVGAATYPQDGDAGADLLRQADAAMYTAKRQGRDRVVSAGDPGVTALDGRDA